MPPSNPAERPAKQAQWLDRVVAVPRLILGTLMLAGIALNFANVIGRYVFAAPIIWAEEAIIYIMVWLVFLGAALVTWDNQHLKMDLLSSSLPGRWRRAVNLLSFLILLAACLFVAVNSFPVVELMTRLGQRSVAGGIPMTIPHAAVFVGFVLMILAVLVRYKLHLAGAARFDLEAPAPGDSIGDSGGPDGPPDRTPRS